MMALVGLAMIACTPLEEDPTPQEVAGLWENDAQAGQFRRFTLQACDTVSYWGWEWDLNEDVTEEDVMQTPRGNGWYSWSLQGKELTMINYTDMGASVPKRYNITLHGDTMVLKGLSNGKKETYIRNR